MQEQVKMKQCPACHKELNEHLQFCPYDGQPLIMKVRPDSLIGTTLDGKFVLEEKIGEGGMGKVYRATHLRMKHTVALKILHPDLSSDEIALERFRREAQAAVLIHHPNAIAVTDFGVTNDTGMAYLVMEFLEGVELREKINREHQLGFEETFYITYQTCLALQAAHAKGIIHRDLKPDNIWLLKTEDGMEQVKVLDFGIAKLLSNAEENQLTQQGMIIGTPYYMSPEQCRGEELDARSDIYSLGIIIYEMLTGRVPFKANTPVAVALKHNSEPPPPPHQLRPDIPPSIEEVVLRALGKRRRDRQLSALALSQEFQVALYKANIDLKFLGSKTLSSAYPTTQMMNINPAPLLPAAINPPNSAEGVRPAEFRSDEISDSSVMPMSRETPTPSVPQGTLDRSPVPAGKRMFYLLAGAAAIITLGILTAIILILTQRANAPTPVNQSPVPIDLAPPAGMIRVPGGSFLMGTNDADAEPESRPAQAVTVAGFFLDVNEVTNLEYQKFIKDKKYPPPPHWHKDEFPPGEATLPVWNVTWYDAKEYAQWAGKRLPTEAEWEFAARGPENRKYPWGNDWSPRFSNSKEDNQDKPKAVGSYPEGRSWCQINDLAGNVAEWVEDEYMPYPNSSVPLKPGFKVLRGGAYRSRKDKLVSWVRYFDKPDLKWDYVGFRCAMDAPK
jgi:eukaryotic-like serine/threonine-protein kinase